MEASDGSSFKYWVNFNFFVYLFVWHFTLKQGAKLCEVNLMTIDSKPWPCPMTKHQSRVKTREEIASRLEMQSLTHPAVQIRQKEHLLKTCALLGRSCHIWLGSLKPSGWPGDSGDTWRLAGAKLMGRKSTPFVLFFNKIIILDQFITTNVVAIDANSWLYCN